MQFFKFIIVLFFAITFVPKVFAECGKFGSVSDRLKDCKNIPNDVEGFDVISVSNSGVFLYSKEKDRIYSPLFKKNEKCKKPYRKLSIKNSKSFRCHLKRASRYYLIQDEVGL